MLRNWLLTTALLLFVALCVGLPVEDNGHFHVYKVDLKGAEQKKLFQQIDVPVNVLNSIGTDGGAADVVVAPNNRIDFENVLTSLRIEFKTVLAAPPAIPPALEWTRYYSLDDIYAFIDYLKVQYPYLVETYTFGYSYEGRPLKGLKISCKPGNKAIFMESQTHGAEWIGSAALTYFINELLTSKNPDLQYLKCAYDWIMVPVVNPDGFTLSKTSGLCGSTLCTYWRKNTRPNGAGNDLFGAPCIGTDLNRNYDDGHFNEAGSGRDDACGSNFSGSESSSEPEIQALQSFYNSFEPNSDSSKPTYIFAYFAWHNYGNYFLIPYGYTTEIHPINYDAMMMMGNAYAAGVYSKHQTKIVSGTSGDVNYRVSGSAKDWAYIKKKVCIAATLELRPYHTGLHILPQYALPENQITPAAEEVTAGLIEMFKKAEEIKIFEICQNAS